LQADPATDAAYLHWEAYEGWDFVESYQVYRVTSYQQASLLASLPGDQTDYLDEEIFCYDAFAYRIVAIGPQRQMAWSDSAFARPDHLLPHKAGHVQQVTVVDNEHLQVSWEAADIERAAEVVLERDAGLGYQEVLRRLALSSDVKYNDLDVDVNHQVYRYRVLSIDSCGDASPVGRLGNNLRLEARQERGNVLLSWNPYEGWEQGVATYSVEVYDEAANQYMAIGSVPGTEVTFEDRNINPGQPVNCYRVIAREQGGNETHSLSNEGCVVLAPEMFSANAFTPNGDGHNDEFLIKGAFVADFQLEIFNRWGNRVFVTQDISLGWSGQNHKGQPAPEGVYVFVARGSGDDGQQVKRVGSITLLR